jgi:ubiquinone/menaquinone biosynthesis C-methylase UbiE
MLSRVLEPEVMDSPEEARDYDAMDHAAVNRVFVADFLAAWDGRGPVLDVGTGTAQIPVALCRTSAAAHVVAVDLAEHMLHVARQNVERAGLGQRIQIERCDAKGLPFADSSFGAVISNSIVHHIPEPGTVLAEMTRVVVPGGLLFVRDLLRPADEPTLRHLVAAYAGDANAHQQQMFADSLRAALTLGEIRALVAVLGHDPASVRQTTDRHWTWVARKASGRRQGDSRVKS